MNLPRENEAADSKEVFGELAVVLVALQCESRCGTGLADGVGEVKSASAAQRRSAVPSTLCTTTPNSAFTRGLHG